MIAIAKTGRGSGRCRAWGSPAKEPIKRSELVKAAADNVAFAMTSIAGPNVLLKDKDSSYPFTLEQMGPYTVTSDAEQTS